MKAIKTFSVLLLLLAACADGSKSAGTTDQTASTEVSRTVPAGPTKSTTPVTADELLAPRGDTRSKDTSEYGAMDGTYRVYGVDGDRATIAEIGTWTTRQYAVGDAFGRGLVVSKIDASGVTLHGAHADVRMPIGEDTELRVIRHDLDVVAQPLGKHRFNLSTPAAKAALDTNPARPSVETVELYDQTMQKLGAIPAKSLWAAADFREGDLLPSDLTLAALETALTDGRRQVEVTIYRGGVAYHRRYEVDAVR